MRGELCAGEIQVASRGFVGPRRLPCALRIVPDGDALLGGDTLELHVGAVSGGEPPDGGAPPSPMIFRRAVDEASWWVDPADDGRILNELSCFELIEGTGLSLEGGRESVALRSALEPVRPREVWARMGRNLVQFYQREGNLAEAKRWANISLFE